MEEELVPERPRPEVVLPLNEESLDLIEDLDDSNLAPNKDLEMADEALTEEESKVLFQERHQV